MAACAVSTAFAALPTTECTAGWDKQKCIKKDSYKDADVWDWENNQWISSTSPCYKDTYNNGRAVGAI